MGAIIKTILRYKKYEKYVKNYGRKYEKSTGKIVWNNTVGDCGKLWEKMEENNGWKLFENNGFKQYCVLPRDAIAHYFEILAESTKVPHLGAIFHLFPKLLTISIT